MSGRHCGADLPTGFKFCHKCGARVGSPNVPSAYIVPSLAPSAAEVLRNWLAAAVVAVVAVLIVVLVIPLV
jgi:hypothetical protein